MAERDFRLLSGCLNGQVSVSDGLRICVGRILESDVFPQGKIRAAGFNFAEACGFQTAFGLFQAV
ncbi:hypothetical protein HMPREF9120_00483 [Neisseria sp. oral taxon 020 str. F0370]|nr:hypothetical protein HMPREF9120_00483 [Neisseria sp. oral taxon 020 str. F0370]